MSDVFLSHSSNDRDAVEKVCAFLEEKGLTCWMAPRDILPGSDWAASISTAITTSKVFLVLFSKNSVSSEQVAREIGVAEAKKGIFVIPYKIDDTELSGAFEYYLTGAHWITADYSNGDYKLEELYSIIAGVTGKSVQNITNNTYIDHLHINSADGSNIQEEIDNISGFNGVPRTAATPGNPMQTQQVPSAVSNNSQMIPAAGDREKNKNTKKIVIPIAAGVIAVVAVLVVVLVISNSSSQNVPYDSSSSSSYGYSSSSSYGQSSEIIYDLKVTYRGWDCTGTYEGEVSTLGKPDGKGSFKGTYVDNDNKTIQMTYEGIFKDGTITGEGIGTQYLSDYTVTCDGMFESGMLNGEAERTLKFNGGDKSSETNKGNFVDGQLNGEGGYTVYFRNGDIYTFEGTLENDKKQQGTARRDYTNGEYHIYEGDFYQDNDNNDQYNNGTYEYYDANGSITKDIKYTNGKGMNAIVNFNVTYTIESNHGNVSTITWDSIQNATGYEIEYGGITKAINYPNYSLWNCNTKTKESINVRAVGVNNGEKIYSNWRKISFETPEKFN